MNVHKESIGRPATHRRLCVPCVAVAHSRAENLTGSVVGIDDGDTLTVLDANKATHVIRLSGIDAPEKSQAFGQRSKQTLSQAVFGKSVTLQCGKEQRVERTRADSKRAWGRAHLRAPAETRSRAGTAIRTPRSNSVSQPPHNYHRTSTSTWRRRTSRGVRNG
jgi:hypothetical protein